MMRKKYVFIDLDGTLIDHTTHSIPDSAKKAVLEAQKNGHEIILATGRPKALFYGIDTSLNITSYIANNGRYVVYKDKEIYSDPIPTNLIEKLVDIAKENQIDIAYEGKDVFTLESQHDTLYKKFSDRFNIEEPTLSPGFYQTNDVYQIIMYYQESDFKKFEREIPELGFHYSCEYGLDVNMLSGLKEIGLNKIVEHLGIDKEDTIAIGDGFNDVSLVQEAHIGVAMGDAPDELKNVADFVTKRACEDGLFIAFKHLSII